MSSTTASVSRNVRSRAGNFGPMMASAPRRNAVSVEITTPHACAWPLFAFSSRKIAAGSASPAMAAMTGTAARAPVGELADGELALHLEADHEEEERHEPVVHELVQREVRSEVADDDLDLGVPELVVRRAPRRSSPTRSR